MMMLLLLLALPVQATQAVFAGGSFWVMEALFAGRSGVKSTETGWMKSGSRHLQRQVVRVEYDPHTLSYGELLTLYWAAVDTFDGEGQFCDRGAEFSPALYVQSSLQQKWAQQSRARLELESGRDVRVRILPVGTFVSAPARHQQYSWQHPLLYGGYRRMCGYPAGERFNLQALAGAPIATSEK
ncbi:methionine-S-sulfoxide reductase [Oceanisphaera arctica]|uniref:Peptide methionine sulfoxide reductase MsrA n=1 Tax=Oceanisphaera arctica TaxID=641510 RepID=A0A2P5TN98_9GAMM|nr:methionine-S-sulfoxide reductase [Oceanisphaera arctica]